LDRLIAVCDHVKRALAACHAVAPVKRRFDAPALGNLPSPGLFTAEGDPRFSKWAKEADALANNLNHQRDYNTEVGGYNNRGTTAPR
jgi:hypothetical protein